MNSATVHLRRLGLAFSFLFLLLAGCGDGAYPEGMKYPLRTDPIVKTPSKTASWYPDTPGNLDDAKQHLLQLQQQQQALSDKVALLNKEKDDPNTPPSPERLKQIQNELEKLHKEQQELDKELTPARAKAWSETLLDPKAIPAVDPHPKNNDRRNGRDRTTLAYALQDIFGTPKGPTVSLPPGEDTNLTIEYIEQDLKLTPPMLANGSVLYRRFCLQCHGLTGNGHGPTGPWVHPHPRDYRQGVFKFISTTPGIGKPSRDDLRHVLTTGVEGTSMPSFALLGDENLEALISYVMHLSLRGEVEFNLCKEMLGEGEFAPDSETVLDEARTLTAQYVQRWYKANKVDGTIVPKTKYKLGKRSFELLKRDNVPEEVLAKLQPLTDKEFTTKPEFISALTKVLDKDDIKRYRDRLLERGDTRAPTPESITRGYTYFTTKGCISCHMDFGRQVPFKSDVWGTPVRPANLTAGVYRGGRRPIDIYWRIRAGIDASNMPSADSALMAGDDDTKVWDVVNFVQALPYPAMLPDDIKAKIYGKEEKDQESARAAAGP